MALTEICAAIVAKLSDISVTGVRVLEQPLPQLPELRTILAYPTIGGTKPGAHRGKYGEPVIEARDLVMVEYHMKNAKDRLADGIEDALPMLDATREALWSGFAQGEFKDSGLMLMHSIDTEHFGLMDTGTDPTFGFRLVLEITHGINLPA